MRELISKDSKGAVKKYSVIDETPLIINLIDNCGNPITMPRDFLGIPVTDRWTKVTTVITETESEADEKLAEPKIHYLYKIHELGKVEKLEVIDEDLVGYYVNDNKVLRLIAKNSVHHKLPKTRVYFIGEDRSKYVYAYTEGLAWMILRQYAVYVKKSEGKPYVLRKVLYSAKKLEEKMLEK